MSSESTPEKGPNVVDLLESAKTDLEEFRKELGQDMVSVHDRYELLKKEMREAIRQMKSMVDENKVLARDISEALQAKLSFLESQVIEQSSRLSDSELMHQLTHIKRAMEDVVKYLGKISVYDLSLARIHDRVYRFKIKMAIIKLKVELGTMQMKSTVMDARYDLKKKIHDLREYASSSEEGLEKRWGLFRKEISEAYEHLHKAFTLK